jgi:scyllo-inositol 2-dehydrogenase (NADP+)
MAIKTGIVGFGISAKVFHAPFISTISDFELSMVVERTKNESQAVYPSVKVVKTIEEMVADKDIELVVITTPNETHFPYTKLALEAGKHVILEKPFANNTKEAGELVKLAAASGRILSVYQNRRYVSDFRTIEELLQKRLLGDVHTFEAHYDRYRAEERPNAWREKPKAGSGILFDLGAHLIDQTFTLFGFPEEITADIRMQRPHAKVDDYFDLRLNYGFMNARLTAGMLVREPGPRYMIHGMQGSFIKFGEDPQEALLRAGKQPVGNDWGQEPDEYYGLLHTQIDGKLIKEKYPSRKGDYGDYYRMIAAAISKGGPVTEKPEHGYNTIKLIELAIESHEKKCTITCEGFKS